MSKFYGFTHSDGSARGKLHGKRDAYHKGTPGCTLGPLNRDKRVRSVESIPKYAPELVKVARGLGMSCDELLRRLAVERRLPELQSHFRKD